MGTRHLISVIVDGEYKVAQYCQWDGYIAGSGVRIFKFLQNIISKNLVEDFTQKVRNLKILTSEEVKQYWIEAGASEDSHFVSLEVAELFKIKYPGLDRDVGPKVLDMILDEKAKETDLSVEFASNSLFCEYAYVIDLDREQLEIYNGFQKSPHNRGRYATLGPYKSNTGIYYPVALCLTLEFSEIADSTESEFLDLCNTSISEADSAIKQDHINLLLKENFDLKEENEKLKEKLGELSDIPGR